MVNRKISRKTNSEISRFVNQSDSFDEKTITKKKWKNNISSKCFKNLWKFGIRFSLNYALACRLLYFDFFFVKTWDEQHSVKNKSLHMRSMNSLRKFGNHGLQNLVKSRWWMIGPLTQRSNSIWPIYFCKLMSCLRKNENLIAWKISKKIKNSFFLKTCVEHEQLNTYLLM